MADRETYLTKDVFVAGAPPKITYNPRDERHLEREMNLYLDQGPGRTLSVSGPTKSGKTVLVERLLSRDHAIWMEGPDLTSVDVFWDRVVDWLGLYDLVEITRQEAEGTGKQMGLTVGVPKVASLSASKNDDVSATRGVRKTRKQAITSVARDSLEAVSTPIVIDDFHYVADNAKQAMARAIKTVIPFCKVVMIAVPHEAFDVVHNEPDMGFRVSQLSIASWSLDELTFIAERGFEALAIRDTGAVASTLAENSYGAPFLMQELCYQYVVVELGLLKTSDAPVDAVEPADWAAFFASIANRTPAAMFDTLLRGPKTRGQKRIARVFKTGAETDVYGALLHGIGKAGNVTVPYQELASIIEHDFVDAISGQQITASLGHMAVLAAESRGTGDPAVGYKNDDLHVLDPFLLFYLRHGNWTVEKQIGDDPEQEEFRVDSDSASRHW